MAIIGLDLSVLFSAQSAGVPATARFGRSAGPRSPAAEGEMSPWDFRRTQPSDSERLTEALKLSRFFNPKDPELGGRDVARDHIQLFAAYQGLSALRTLAESAADSKTSAQRRGQLDAQFQRGLAEAQSFFAGLKLDRLSLLAGASVTRAESELSVSRRAGPYVTRPLEGADASTELTGLPGSGGFTIRIDGLSGEQDIAIDFSQMGATPRTLTNVVGFINQALADAGVQTRLRRTELTPPAAGANQPTPAKRFGIRIEGTTLERVSFIPDAPAASVSVIAQAGDAAELRKFTATGAAETLSRTETSTSQRPADVQRVAAAQDGGSYVLSTTRASVGGQVNLAERDVMLSRYDSAGRMIWSKLLGVSQNADGLALASDASGNVVIAGRITGRLGAAQNAAGGADSFVVKYNASGEEQWARQIGSVQDDRATALAIDADGAVYAGGETRGAMTGASASGDGLDAYVVKFTADGTRSYTRQLASAGDERLAGLAIAADGDLIALTQDNGAAVLRKFAAADASSPAVWEKTLGTLEGTLGGLVASGSSIYVTGATTNGALTAGGEASVAQAHGGSLDAFLMRVDDAGASATAQFVSYLGGTGAERAHGVAVAGGRVYVTGDTAAAFAGAPAIPSGGTAAFLAAFDVNGAEVLRQQFAVSGGAGSARAILAQDSGASALDVLGLPQGVAGLMPARSITAQSTVRPGDYFDISVNGAAAQRVTIAAGETMASLAAKIGRAVQFRGKVTVTPGANGDRLRIEPQANAAIELKAGAGALDALQRLGLTPGRIAAAETEGSTARAETNPVYGLGLKTVYALRDTGGAAAARSALTAALQTIRTAYRDLVTDPAAAAALEAQNPAGRVSPDTLRQLANYRAGLARLTGGSG